MNGIWEQGRGRSVRGCSRWGGEKIDRHGLNWVCKTRGFHVYARDWGEYIIGSQVFDLAKQQKDRSQANR
jgi:hypothetical protein